MIFTLFGTTPANSSTTMKTILLSQPTPNFHLNPLRMLGAYALGMALGYAACLFSGIA